VVLRNQERRHMTAIHVFEFASATDAGDYNSGVFFAEVLLGEEAIYGRDNVSQRHLRNQVGIDHALQSRREQGGRDSLTADIGYYYGKVIGRTRSIEEVSTDFFARHVAPAHAREGHFRDVDFHQALLD
jgi:hypothetical protein